MANKRPVVISNRGTFQQLQSGDFVGIDAGGTGAGDAATARANLGLAIGTNVQAYSALLDSIANLSGNGAMYKNGTNTVLRTLQAPSRGITISNADGAAGNPTFALANNLAALEGLTGAGFSTRTGVDTWAQRVIAGTAGQIAVANGDGVSGNPTLSLATVTQGSAGTSFLKLLLDGFGRVTGNTPVTASDISGLVDTRYLQLSGGTLTGPLYLSQDPVGNMEAATRQWVKSLVDNILTGTPAKAAVTVCADTNINISSPGGNIVDGYTLAVNDTVLLTGQTNASQNGPYVFKGTGVPMVRRTDADGNSEITVGASFFVSNGAQYDNCVFTLITPPPYTIGTTNLTFTQSNGIGSVTVNGPLTKAGNQLGLAYTSALTMSAGQLDLATLVTAGSGIKFSYDKYGRITGTLTASASDVGAQPVNADLTAISGISTTGMLARTAAGTYTTRQIAVPTRGISITNPDGVAGNPTIALSNNLAGLESLTGTSGIGIVVRSSSSDTFIARKIVSSGSIGITNPKGDSGDISLDLSPTGVSAGTYANPSSMTVNDKGQITAITAGVGGSGGNSIVTKTNADSSTAVSGMAVFSFGAGTFKLGRADSVNTCEIVGLMVEDVLSNGSGRFQCNGEVTLTTAQWDAVTGATGGLTPGATYFLSNVSSGKMTPTVPSTGVIARLGVALDATKFLVKIEPTIQL